MKKLIKPSRNERQIIEQAGLDAREWLIERKNHQELIVVHRTNGQKQSLSL